MLSKGFFDRFGNFFLAHLFEMQPVFCLLPVVRLEDELQEAFPGADAHQHPVRENDERVFNELIILTHI